MFLLGIVTLGVIAILASRSKGAREPSGAPATPPEASGPGASAFPAGGAQEGLQGTGDLSAILAAIANAPGGVIGPGASAPKLAEWYVLGADSVWRTTVPGFNEILRLLSGYTSYAALYRVEDNGSSMASAYDKRDYAEVEPSAQDRYRDRTNRGDVALIEKIDLDKIRSGQRVDLLTTYYVPPALLARWVGPAAPYGREYVVVARPAA